MDFKGKYEQLAEATISRYQSSGILIGDLIKFRKNILNHPKIKELGDNVKGAIKSMMDSDLTIRVCATRSVYPDVNASGGLGLSVATTPTEFWVDVCQEYAPGLFKNPMSLPVEVIEVIETGINGAPVPDSLKRKGKINIKGKAVDYVDNKTDASSRTLPTKNTVLDYVKGSAKQPVLDSVKKNDEDMLQEAYGKVISNLKSKILTVCVANVFSENVENLLSNQNIKHFKSINGQKTYFDIVFNESKEELEKFIRKNAIGHDTFMQIVESDQQIEEN